MKKIILILGMFLILPIISALDSGLPMICGGDDELLISCLGDDELIFLSEKVPAEVWSKIGVGPDHTTVPKKEIPEVEVVPTWFKSLGLDEIGIKYSAFMTILCFFLFACVFLILIYKKKKKKKQTKKFEGKEKKENGN